MSEWNIKFNKEKDIGEDTYLKKFLQQAELKIDELQLSGSINSFVRDLEHWCGYNNYYNSGKFICRGGYMNIDKLRRIHSNSNHSIFDAYKDTRESVYKVYKKDSDDLYPIIPFVLIPEEFTNIRSNKEMILNYNIEKEGRSRLAGVLKARRNGYYKNDTVPVQFSIRRVRR